MIVGHVTSHNNTSEIITTATMKNHWSAVCMQYIYETADGNEKLANINITNQPILYRLHTLAHSCSIKQVYLPKLICFSLTKSKRTCFPRAPKTRSPVWRRCPMTCSFWERTRRAYSRTWKERPSPSWPSNGRKSPFNLVWLDLFLLHYLYTSSGRYSCFDFKVDIFWTYDRFFCPSL